MDVSAVRYVCCDTLTLYIYYVFLFAIVFQASTGIANLLLRALVDAGVEEEKALEQIWLFDIHGLLTEVCSSTIIICCMFTVVIYAQERKQFQRR